MTLESIQNYCNQQNFAGNTHIQCVPVSWIENYPEFAKDGHNFSQAIDLKVGRNWLVFPCVPDTLDFRERERVGAHGPIATPTISGFLPNDTPKIAGVLNASKANEWVVILYYKTGAAKVIGSPDYPARFSSSFTNRGSLNSGKGYDIEFYSEGDFKTFFLDELPEVVDAVCLPATVTNGANYTGTVASGDVLLLPNENITVNGSLLVNKPSVEDFDVEVVDSNDNPTGVISDGKVVVADTFAWEFRFKDQVAIIDIEVDATMLHTFTSGSGVNIDAVEISTDGLTYVPITYPFTPSVGALYVKRDPALISAIYKMIQ